jgi:hypothetical protein
MRDHGDICDISLSWEGIENFDLCDDTPKTPESIQMWIQLK